MAAQTAIAVIAETPPTDGVGGCMRGETRPSARPWPLPRQAEDACSAGHGRILSRPL